MLRVSQDKKAFSRREWTIPWFWRWKPFIVFGKTVTDSTEHNYHFKRPTQGKPTNNKIIATIVTLFPSWLTGWVIAYNKQTGQWIVRIEQFSIECHKTKTKVITLATYKRHKNETKPNEMKQTIQWTNQNSKQIHVAGTKCRKTCASETRLVLVLVLIGWENGARFLNQSLSVVMQNQCKRNLLSTLKWKLL